MNYYRKKIFIVSDGYPTPKNLLFGLYVKEQFEAIKLQKKDWQFDVFYNPFFNLVKDPLKKKSFLWNALKWSMQLICFIPSLFKKYDLIHAHRFFMPVFNAVAYKFFHPKVPLVVTSHGIVQVRKRYNRKWTKRLFHYCDLIIAVNHEMRQEYIEHFDLPEEKVVVRSCGIDLSDMDKLAGKQKEHDDICLGFVGIYTPNKKPGFFVDCIKELKDDFPIRGIMIGGGLGQKAIEKEVETNSLPISIYDTLPHTEVIKKYAEFDLLLFPSTNETFGIVGIEALYCGVPVVASSVGGKKDYIKNGVNGYLFEKDDYSDMMKKVRSIVADPEKMTQMKNNAKDSVRNYSRELVAKDIIRYYDMLLNDR